MRQQHIGWQMLLVMLAEGLFMVNILQLVMQL